ncbi:MAG: PcfB family protein, partial [Oscillospiraceae bacterium]|nr:PcfB family protein [Oscillospiraceae bacterium]
LLGLGKNAAKMAGKATFVLTAKSLKLTKAIFMKMLEKYIQRVRNVKANGIAEPGGIQSVKSLMSDGKEVNTIDIADEGIKRFNRTARKYGVTYAVECNKAEDPPTWSVFFRAKDVDVLTAAFKDYLAAEAKAKTKEKPSVKARLAEKKAQIKAMPVKVKTAEHGSR